MSEVLSQRRWSVEKRLEFIEFQLFWYGGINRSDIRRKFVVSAQQASADLGLYHEVAPNNLTYDPRGKRYLASAGFKPVFGTPESDAFLWQLRDDVHFLSESGGISLQDLPSHDIVRLPKRSIDPSILRVVAAAIREGKVIEVLYQSMSAETPAQRKISPHAFAFDGHRWHVRAFCHKGMHYKDFLLARIQEISVVKGDYVSGETDQVWNSFFTLVLKPNPKLSKNQSLAVALDFGMVDMKLHIKMRLAFLYYFLRRLELQDCDGEHRDPREQHVVIDNKKETKLAIERTLLNNGA